MDHSANSDDVDERLNYCKIEEANFMDSSNYSASEREDRLAAGSNYAHQLVKSEDNKSSISASANNPNNNNNMSVELCLVCNDRASGRHYGAISCEGCKGFFKRSIRKQLAYQCRGTMNCEITKHHRNRCQFCRLQKCLACGMRSDSVQHERKPMLDKKAADTLSTASPNASGGSSSVAATVPTPATSSFSQNRAKPFWRNDFATGTPTENFSNNLPMFPVGFNLAELTSSLAQRGMLPSSFQASQLNTDPANISGPPISLSALRQQCFLNNLNNDDDSSMDNTSPIILPAMNTLNTLTTEASNVMLQTAIDKNIVAQSLEMIGNLQFDQPPFQNNNESNHNNNCSGYKDEIDDDDFDEMINFEEPLLQESDYIFNLQTPTLVPAYLNLHYICECGSRLLFSSIYWIKKIQAFKVFRDDTQITLLRNSWVELFVLGLAQCSESLSLTAIMSSLINFLKTSINQEKILPNKIKRFSEHIWRIQDFINGMNRLELDDCEYAYLKLIALFNADNVGIDATQRPKIERIQEIALIHLKTYTKQKRDLTNNDHLQNQHNSTTVDRVPKLLLKLLTLRALESEIIEDLFFTNLIGQVQIENVIPYILKLGGAGIKTEN